MRYGLTEELEQEVEATERDFVNFVGDNADKYLRKFKKFNVDGVDNFEWTWHWPAFFFGFWWPLYRKLYVWALIAFLLSIISLIVPYWFFVNSIIYALIGNYIYYKHAKQKIIKYKTAKAPVDPHKAAIATQKRWSESMGTCVSSTNNCHNNSFASRFRLFLRPQV